MATKAYILIEAKVGKLRDVANELRGMPGVEQVDPVTGPYDVIAVTGSLPLAPNNYKKQLSTGGRLFCIVGHSPAMECLIITRVSDTQWSEESFMETDLPALINAPQPSQFSL